MKCLECKYFNNTIPVTTSRREDSHKFPEKYIGKCENIQRPKMMNDYCQLYEKKEKKEGK